VAVVDIKLAHLNDVTIQVYNTVGQIVYSKSYNNLSNEQLISIPTSNLTGGIYTAKIKVADQIITQQIVVAH
ncbi:MAG: T9SS type A sorting domain-containing protein, partial [Chitinophagales bacterium]|nr:T9SS type A sorting domain-containing protein [Chitinophagales bacterium]